MAFPVSAKFEVFDWGADTTPFADGPKGIATYPDLVELVDVQLDAAPTMILSAGSTLKVEANLALFFTLEFEVVFTELPTYANQQNWAGLDEKRVFVAIADQQDQAVGLLFSTHGLALVSYPDNTVVPLGNTKDLVSLHTSTTIRLAVNGDANTVDIYVTKTADIPVTGQVLRMTVQTSAFKEPTEGGAGNIEGAHIEVVGAGRAVFSSLRLTRSVLSPFSRPVANAGNEIISPIEGIAQLNGLGSSDADGGLLTYTWTVSSAPEGSNFSLSGAGKASLTHSHVAGDGIIFRAKSSGAAGNLVKVQLQELGGNQALGIALVGSTVLITLQQVAGVGVTTYGQLVAAINAEGHPASGLLTASLVVGGHGMEIVPVGALGVATSLAGGNDSALANPTFTTDTIGTYQVQLVVNNGNLDSLPAYVLVIVHATVHPLGHIPDAEFIWKGLPDFWKLVPDKEPFQTFWSGAIQAISGEMLKAWQVDYNKSLADIQKTFSRKWLRFSPLVTDTPRIEFEAVDDPELPGSKKVQEKDKLDSWLRVPTVGVLPTLTGASGRGEAEEPLNGFKLYTNIFAEAASLSQINEGDLIVDTDNNRTYEVRTKAGDNRLLIQDNGLDQFRIPYYDLIDSGTNNGRASDDSAGDDLTTRWWGLGHGVLKLSAIEVGDLLWISNPDGSTSAYTIDGEDADTSTVSINPVAETYTIGTPDGEISMAVKDRSWKIVRKRAPFSWVVAPHIASDLDLVEDELVEPGDLVRFMVTTKSSTTVNTVHSKVLGVLKTPWGGMYSGSGAKSKVVFDPGTSPVFDDGGGIATAGTGLLGTIYSFRKPKHTALFYYEYQGILRLKNISLDSSVESAPNLRYPIATPTSNVADTLSLKEGLNYNVKTPTEMQAVGYAPATTKAAVVFKDIYSESILPPDHLWAEIAHFDNETTIEANFGKRVGADLEDFEGRNLDYLSAVQALWFAFFSGPSVSNIRLGAQVFFGLPYAEVAGTVLSIDPEYTPTKGRILLEDKDNADVQRSYTYPSSVGTPITETQDTVVTTTLSKASTIGLKIIEVVSSEGFEEDQTLTIGNEVNRVVQVLGPHLPAPDHDVLHKLILDSALANNHDAAEAVTGTTVGAATKVKRFAPLSHGVTVDDYVKTPRWFVFHMQQGLLTEVEKFFTFRIQLDARAAPADNFDLVAKFVHGIKPVYTTPLFTVLLSLDGDQVDVLDFLESLNPTLLLFDHPRGAPNQPHPLALEDPPAQGQLDNTGHPTAVMFDGYSGSGSTLWDEPLRKNIVDMDIRADRSSPRYHFTAVEDAGNTNKLQLDPDVYIPAEFFSTQLLESNAGEAAQTYNVVVHGTINNDGRYQVIAKAADYSWIKVGAWVGGLAVDFTENDQGTLFLCDSAADGRTLDVGINEPKAIMDGGIVPYMHTVNRAYHIDLDYDYINKKKVGEGGYVIANAQSGPRVDQGLIVDDYLTMDRDNLAKTPNMGNTTLPTGGGNGLFWWFDGGNVAEKGFYTSWLLDGPVIRPDGAVINAGDADAPLSITVTRVVGHKGLSLPPDNPNIFLDSDDGPV